MMDETSRKLLITLKKVEEVCPMNHKKCPWAGNSVLEHLKKHYPEYIKNTNIIKLDLKENSDIFIPSFLNNTNTGEEFGVALHYNPQEIELTLLELDKKYTLKLHSPDFEKHLLLQISKLETVVTAETLNLISANVIYVEIKEHQTYSRTNRAVLTVLECPLCMETMKNTSIRQCPTGHSFCATCIQENEISQCPLCRETLKNTINYALMQLSTELFHPCKNKDTGCDFQGLHKQLLQHEVFCRPCYECPFKKLSNNCTFIGEKTTIIQHCLNNHLSEIDRQRCLRIQLTKYEDSRLKSVIYVYENIFEIVVKYEGDDDSFFTVRLYDGEMEAEKYSFTVMIGEGTRKMTFSDVCKSITDDESGLHISIKPLKGTVLDFTICITEN